MDAPQPPTSPPSRAADNAARRAARLATPRLGRELQTIAAMLRIWCIDHHGDAPRLPGEGHAPLCAECAGLHAYARKRLAGCPYGPDKPTCVNCPIHCYGKRQREQVREVMRYAGPRMLWRHPWLALAHVADGRRPVPPRPNEQAIARAQAAGAGAAPGTTPGTTPGTDSPPASSAATAGGPPGASR